MDGGAIAPLAAPVSGRYEARGREGSYAAAVADYGMAGQRSDRGGAHAPPSWRRF